MKIWKWYQKITKEQRENCGNLPIEDMYPLYAFTTDKEHRDLWRETRRKECFIEIESKISKEDYVEFANKHRGNLLDLYSYSRFDGYKSDSTEVSMGKVKILSTWNEREYTDAMLETCMDHGSGMCTVEFNTIPPIILKDKYFKALYDLQYVSFWRLYNSAASFYSATDDYVDDVLESMGIEVDYATPDFENDEFAAFIFLFSRFLKV